MNSTLDSTNRRWLVVDDNPSVSSLMGLILRGFGQAEVEEFTSSRGAFARTCQNQFDLVITDRDMPEMDGMEFARRVHAHSPNAVIVMVSAHVDDLTREALQEAGISAVLAKPFSVARIEALIRGLACETAAASAPSDSPMVRRAA